MQEFIILDSGSRFKASDLGLELDHMSSHMNITQTRLRILQMEGQRVDVVDSKGRITAIWKVVKEAKEDEELIRQRQQHFLDHGLCDMDFTSPNFSLCNLFFQLWPGDREKQLHRLNVEICQANKNAARRAFGQREVSDCTMDEYLTFIAILIGATCYYKGGDALWWTKSKGIVAPPEFGKYMTHYRFKELRRHVSHVMAWPELKQDYAWWRIGAFVCDFNANRRRFIAAHQWKILDELMSLFHPRTRKTGNLPNISYVIRKPKALGTEFKCVVCPKTGAMLAVEVQEGKERMAKVSTIICFIVL